MLTPHFSHLYPCRVSGQFPPPPPDNSPWTVAPHQFPPGQFPPGQFPLRSISPWSIPPQDNSPLGQLPPRIIAPWTVAPRAFLPVGEFPPSTPLSLFRQEINNIVYMLKIYTLTDEISTTYHILQCM